MKYQMIQIKKIFMKSFIIMISLSLIGCGSQKNSASVSKSNESSVVKQSGSAKSAVESKQSSSSQDESDGLTSTQRNSINMLNYMTVLTQKINEAKGNQLYLESAYDSLTNDIYPNAIDNKTQIQMMSLLDTIENYRMISVKRERLQYIYEQNRAQIMKQAIPSPVALLSAVQSGSVLKAAASVFYMAVDSYTSYQSASSQADLQMVKDGWELDDEESSELHNSTKNALSYMINMVRDYDLPGDYALNQEAVENFVSWSNKPDSQLVGKIAWLEKENSVYRAFGPYWLELAKDYYKQEDYNNCLKAIDSYESISTRIFRKDIDYATVLPLALVSAKSVMGEKDYINAAEKYCSLILKNTKDADWSLRYFAAQTYLDLYKITKKDTYLKNAYTIAFDNVNILVDQQRNLNTSYLGYLELAKVSKNATKREKKEVKRYNKLLKKERKSALPPVSEALHLNCDLLFAVAEKLNISSKEKEKINAILHENGNPIFLSSVVDQKFTFSKKKTEINVNKINVTFNGEEIEIPASCVTDRYEISVDITRSGKTKTLKDWIVSNVSRSVDKNVDKFSATFKSKKGKDYKYKAGDIVVIKVNPVAGSSGNTLEFSFKTVVTERVKVIKEIKFERIKK